MDPAPPAQTIKQNTKVGLQRFGTSVKALHSGEQVYELVYNSMRNR